MRIAVVFLVVALAAAGSGVAFMYAGLVDVAATSSHFAVTRWILSTSMDRSVKRHARGIAVPASLDDAERIQEAASAYDAMCADCHGAPGVSPGVVGKGLNPEPPDLEKTADEWSAAEIFWIIGHGVRMTGMPAFGPTHSDTELWELAALVKKLPAMSSEAYRELVAAQAGHEHRHAHSHEHELGHEEGDTD